MMVRWALLVLITLLLAAAVKRDLEAVAHIHGDIGAAEIERRYQAAMREIRWRHAHDAT